MNRPLVPFVAIAAKKKDIQLESHFCALPNEQPYLSFLERKLQNGVQEVRLELSNG